MRKIRVKRSTTGWTQGWRQNDHLKLELGVDTQACDPLQYCNTVAPLNSSELALIHSLGDQIRAKGSHIIGMPITTGCGCKLNRGWPVIYYCAARE